MAASGTTITFIRMNHPPLLTRRTQRSLASKCKAVRKLVPDSHFLRAFSLGLSSDTNYYSKLGTTDSILADLCRKEFIKGY
jgi:hypothetical protein